MVTMRDVAREAGVAVSTVSFAFNGTAPVAPETKERIFEVIRRLNYQPNFAARGLATQKTRNLCLYTPHPGSKFFNFSDNSTFTDLLQGLGEVIDKKGYNLLLSWDNEREPVSRALVLARQRSVDGMLFMLPSHNHEMIGELTETGLPFLIMGRYDGTEPVYTVDIDNYDAARRNTRHLIELGHRRIAFISPGPLEFLVCADRLSGYRDALTSAGLERRDEYVHIGDDRQISGYEAARRFLALPEPPTAVVAGRDIQAVGVLEYARTHGLKVPQELAVASFENCQLARDHGLTSITTNLYEIGRQGATLLFKIIERKRKGVPQNIIIPSELVIRSSSGAAETVRMQSG